MHIDSKLPAHDGIYYKHNPFDLQNSHCIKPVFPIHQLNLRIPVRGNGRSSKSRRRGRKNARSRRGRSCVWNGGHLPLYKRFPKWRDAIRQWRSKPLEWCSLRKLLKFIKAGRLDARFPITQRHINDSNLVRVKRGVKLFNTDDLPFPYRIHIEVSAADQSSINAINNVGGSVTIVYRNRLNLRAHLYPKQFEILPRTGRPDLNAIFALEKYRARGCIVHYIKPLWLLQEEAIAKSELAASAAEKKAFAGGKTTDPVTLDDWKEKLLENFRIRTTKLARQRTYNFTRGNNAESIGRKSFMRTK